MKRLGIVLSKEDFTYIYLAFIYENLIISDLFKTFTLNFTMHILTILTCSLKLRLGNRFFKTQTSLNPISMYILRRPMTKVKDFFSTIGLF